MSFNIDEKDFFEFKLEKIKNDIKDEYSAITKELEAQNKELKSQIDVLNSKMVEPKIIEVDENDDFDYVI